MSHQLALGIALSSWLASGAISEGPPAPLQPETYRSQSGAWELRVDPTSRYGEGAGDHELWHGDRLVWKERHPFTFFEAAVTEDGLVAGYAYTHGWRDMPNLGSFVVASVGRDGKVAGQEITKRVSSSYLHTAADPKAQGLVLDAEHGSFVVLLHDADENRDWTEWRRYDLATCRLVRSFRPSELAQPAEEHTGTIWSARAIPGTPLIATYESVLRFDLDPTRYDARIGLVDAEGRTVWSQVLAGDLDHGDETDAWIALRDLVVERGGVIATAPAGGFSIWSPKARERIDFRAEADEAQQSWRVDELGRSAHEPPPDPPSQEPLVAALELKPLAVTQLRAPEAPDPGPIRDVQALGIDAAGRLMVLRQEEEDVRWTCLSTDEKGAVLGERSFGPLEIDLEGEIQWWPFESGRWLVTCSPWERETMAQLWWADPATGVLEPIEGLELPKVEAVASTRDGGFVALVEFEYEYNSASGLASVDRLGRLRWLHVSGPGYSGEESELLSPQDVAFTSDGLAVVVDSVRDTLQVFRGDGQWVRTQDLTATLQSEHTYPCEVLADLSGGVIVRDSANHESPLVRCDLEGRLQGRIVPRRQDGSRDPRLASDLVLAPNGCLWTHDGQRVVRLGEDGAVDVVLGSTESPEAIYSPAETFVDPLGRILVLDWRTKAVHVFDRNGTRLWLGSPQEHELLQSYGLSLAVGADGSIYIGGWGSESLRFGPAGGDPQRTDLGGSRAVFFPRGDKRLVELDGEDALAILHSSGDISSRIDRLPNRKWFGGSPSFSVASDGALVVADSDFFTLHETSTLAVYGEDGSPRSSVALPTGTPRSRLAATATWIAVGGSSSELLLVRRQEETLFRFNVAGAIAEESNWDFGFSPDGKELWMVERERLRLHRFELPSNQAR